MTQQSKPGHVATNQGQQQEHDCPPGSQEHRSPRRSRLGATALTR